MNSESSQKRRIILLVEDNPTDELLTIRALSSGQQQAEVVVARNGSEALDYVFGTGIYSGRDTRQVPSFILLDLKLPKISGLKVLQKIRSDKRTRCIPVIVLTSSKEEKDLIACYRLGANSYIQKPVDFQEFLQVTEQLGVYWFKLNQLPGNNV